MKKTYIAPSVSQFELGREEGILCMSVGVNKDPQKDITFQSINRPSVWDASNWAEIPSEEDAKQSKR